MSKFYTFKSLYEGEAPDHPDIKGQTEFQSRVKDVMAKRVKERAARAAANTPQNIRARRAAAFFTKSVIPKEEFELDWEYYIDEAHMTAADKKKEERLKNKYDDSGMKASMIKQYGPEKGKQVYFAYIRKQAMKEAFGLDEELLDEAKQTKEQRRISRQISTERRKKQLQQRKKSKAFSAKKPKELLSVDLDDTLGFQGVEGKPDTPINVTNKAGEVKHKLNNQEYNAHKQEQKLKPGEKYGYSAFSDVPTLKATATWNKRLKSELKRKLRRRSTRNSVHLTSARGRMAQGTAALQGVLANQGLNIPAKNIHLTGDMRSGDTAERKVTTNRGIAHRHQNRSGVRPIVTAIDDFKPTLDAHIKANQQDSGGRSRGGSRRPRFKAKYVGPYKKGGVMPKPYRPEKAVKEDFELWLEEILDEGYDVSDLTLEDLCYLYAEELLEEYEDLQEAGKPPTVATASPAPGEGRPSKKYPSKAPYKKAPKFKSPYSGRPPKKEYPMEEEMTPYDFWKSYIPEEDKSSDEEGEENYGINEDSNIEERTLTSYDYWKSFIEEQAGSEDRGERHVAHDMATKNRDANQKVTIVSTASRPGNTPSLKLPISSVPHVHMPKARV